MREGERIGAVLEWQVRAVTETTREKRSSGWLYLSGLWRWRDRFAISRFLGGVERGGRWGSVRMRSAWLRR